MFNQTKKVIATALGIGLLTSSVVAAPMLALPASAAEEPHGDPVAVSALSNDWMALPAGEARWYRVDYDAFEENGTLSSETIVELEMGTKNSIGFEVYTAQQAQEWANGKDVEPVGVGAQKSDFTGNDDHDTKLLWANRTAASETFYIAVQNETSAESYYKLDISGKGTSYPINTPAVSQSIARSAIAATTLPQPTAQEIAPTLSVAAASNSGFGPDTAMAPNNVTVTLAAGETMWYTFDYDYDGDGTPEDATATLRMNKADSISFEVWTPDTVRSWANNDDFDPVGRGSVFSEGNSNEDLSQLVWVGSTPASGKYYVLVENTTNAPATYTLTVTGSTVSF